MARVTFTPGMTLAGDDLENAFLYDEGRIDAEASLSKQFSRSGTNNATLQFDVYGGNVPTATVPIVVVDTSLTLAANSTNYVEQDLSTGVISSNTTAWTAGQRALYQVVTDGVSILSVTDFRGIGGPGAAAPDASDTVKGISKLSVAPVSSTAPIAVGDNDSRMTDARTPTLHHTSHNTGGTDAIAPADIGAATAADLTAHTSAAAPHSGHLKADGTVASLADQDAGGFRLTNLADGTSAQDAATKAMVDAVALGYKDLENVLAMATANVALSGLGAIDGVTPVDGDRVLLVGQTTASENGPWLAHAGSWTRPTDFASASTPDAGTRIFVVNGTAKKGTSWTLLTASATVDTDPLAWTQTGAAGTGEANTSSNVGTGAGQFAKPKSGLNLPFKSLLAGSSKLAVTNNTDDVTVDVVTANIDKNALGGSALAVANGGTGITGGAFASLLFFSNTNVISALAPNVGTTIRYLSCIGDGSVPTGMNWTTLELPGYVTTSTTTVLFATGTRVFTVDTGLGYSAGQRVRATLDSDVTKYVEGLIGTYSGSGLSISVDRVNGSGSGSAWHINLAADPPAADGNQSANTVKAGPASGSAAAPGYRALVADDIPTVTLAKISDAGTAAAVDDSTLAHLAGTETISGAKTFSVSPVVPTPSPGDNSTKAASTAYADAAVALAVTGLLKFVGSTDCSGTPNYPAATKGDSYVVSVAGKIGGSSGKAVDIGDVYVASANNAGGDQATVGASWFILEHNLVGAMLTATYDANADGKVDLAAGGTGADLSASGGSTKVLAQDASHVVTARDLIAADIPSLAASKITSGQLGLAQGGTGADLSASGGATSILAQDASHVVTARSLIAADIPSIDASKVATGQLALAQGGTGVDLSAAGGSGQVLKMNASHVISSAALVTADLPASGVSAGTYGGVNTSAVLAIDATGRITSASSSNVYGVLRPVAQTAHGFSNGNCLKLTGSDTYAKAQADSYADAAVCGIAVSVSTNLFSLVPPGSIAQLTGLTAGATYYLDPTTPGATTTTDPGLSGNLSVPVFYALTTSLAIVIARKPATLINSDIPATLSGKRITKRVLNLSAGSATPAINTDSYDAVHITAQSAAITSLTTNLTGTPVQGDELLFDITDDGTARAIAWGASFEDGNYPLPTTTVISTRLDVRLRWNPVTSKWRCVDTKITLPSGAVVGVSDVQTLTNKRITRRAPAITQSATPTINTDVTDVAHITGLAQAITSMTTNLSGTPVEGDMLKIDFTDNGTARAITWGTSFEASTVALPTTTVISTRLDVLFAWNTATSKWRCLSAV